MFVKVGVAIQHKAASLKIGITPSTSSLLHIVLQRVGYVVVHHQPHIFFINAHTKCRGCDDNAHPVGHKGVLIGNLFIGIHLAAKG